jgi:hypothetical protein
MALRFVGIDRGTDGDHCPAVFVDEENGDLLFKAQWSPTQALWRRRRVTARWRDMKQSEPLSDYIRYEHALTGPVNIAAGEAVRWLPRRRASDLCLPGNDFWVFDDRMVRLHHFAGNGEWLDDEISHDPALVNHCLTAFEAVWERAIDHADYLSPKPQELRTRGRRSPTTTSGPGAGYVALGSRQVT